MGISKQKVLDKIYNASNWVTFINPKVDLNYFQSDPSAKDLLIIPKMGKAGLHGSLHNRLGY